MFSPLQLGLFPSSSYRVPICGLYLFILTLLLSHLYFCYTFQDFFSWNASAYLISLKSKLFIIRCQHLWLHLPICKHLLVEIHTISLYVALLGLRALRPTSRPPSVLLSMARVGGPCRLSFSGSCVSPSPAGFAQWEAWMGDWSQKQGRGSLWLQRRVPPQWSHCCLTGPLGPVCQVTLDPGLITPPLT